jgi:hypothetical protein
MDRIEQHETKRRTVKQLANECPGCVLLQGEEGIALSIEQIIDDWSMYGSLISTFAFCLLFSESQTRVAAGCFKERPAGGGIITSSSSAAVQVYYNGGGGRRKWQVAANRQ